MFEHSRSLLLARRYTVPAVAALALIYALFAGLRTMGDPDVGWCMATGRWIFQHHSLPSTDVLSYTAYGQEWIYPLLSQVLLYCTYLFGGYSLLSWLGAAACTGTVAIFLRRGRALALVLAALVVPMIAARTSPRAEMFTEVLFAAFVSVLWHYHRSGSGSLWVLPVLMCFWVNLHPGFIAGLGMCVAYVLLEFEDAAAREHRGAALERLRRAAPWLAATGLATFLNPWGPRIYLAVARQNNLNRIHSRWIADWLPVRLTPSALSQAFVWRDPDVAILWLMAAGVLAMLAALYMRRITSVLLLGTSIYLVSHAARLEGPFASIAVIVGGSILADALVEIGWIRQCWQRLMPGAAVAVVVVLAFFVVIRVWDLVSNRYYLRESRPYSIFGAGESPLFPDRAAEFLLREHLPANIFNDFNSGGFLTWALSPTYPDYIDGRSVPFGADLSLHSQELLRVSLNSGMWQREADQRNINTVIVSIDYVLGSFTLSSLEQSCQSQQWRPVYMDTEAAVFMRVRPETTGLISRFEVDCNTVRFGNPPVANGMRGRAEQFKYHLNAASILVALDRNRDALGSLESAERIFPDNPYLHYLKGIVFHNLGFEDKVEQELRTSIDLGSEDAPFALARYYERQGRFGDEASTLEHAAELSATPHLIYVKLAYAQLAMGRPDKALISFDKAEKASPFVDEAEAYGAEFRKSIAEGRAEACRNLKLK